MLRWLALGVAVAAIAVTTFFVFHHPPMRLMPAPLMFRDGGPAGFDVAPLFVDDRIELFYATNRLPVGERDDRIYTVVPDRQLHLGTATTRIGEGSTIDELLAWSTAADRSDRPFVFLERMREVATLPAGAVPDADAAAWLAEIDAALAAAPSPDLVVYVHGANTTVERAAGQAAQLRHFAGRAAVVVLYVWPTAENFLRYPRDIRNAFGGAPHLADLLALLAENTRARSVGVFTYSAGATIGSEALARLTRERPAAAAKLGEIYHAAPDADFRGFVADLGVYGPEAQRVTAAVNLGDSALRLAGAVNRASRAGRPDLRELDDESTRFLIGAADDQGLEIVQVDPDAMPYLAATSHTFWYDDPWVSNDVLATLLFHLPPAERQLEAASAVSGTRYWTFPADYPERLPALERALQVRVEAARAAQP